MQKPLTRFVETEKSKRKIRGAKYRIGQNIDFSQKHCKRDLPFTGEILGIEKCMHEIIYHCIVLHSDGTLFAIVREQDIKRAI